MQRPYDLDHLRSLVLVARHGSITEAARALRRSTSAISIQLKTLQDALGRKLFRRHSRGIALTKEGEIALELAKKILALTHDLEASLTARPMAGLVRIGLSPDIAAGPLPRILRDLVEWRHELDVQLVVALSSEIGALLRKGEVDLAVASTEFAGYPAEIRWHTPLVWAASRDFSLDVKRPLPLALSGQRPQVWEKKALERLRRHGLSWRVVLSATNIASVIAAVEVGIGVGLMTRDCVRPTMRILSELDGLPPPIEGEFGIFIARGSKGPRPDALVRLIRTALHGPG